MDFSGWDLLIQLPMKPVYFWLILAVALAGVEMMTLTFFVLPFSLGSLIAAVAALITADVNTQIWICALASLGWLVVCQILYRRYQRDTPHKVKSNVDALVGKKALVTEEIVGEAKRGFVKIGGEVWSAISPDEQKLIPGTAVYVHAVEGAKVIVSIHPPVEEEERLAATGT